MPKMPETVAPKVLFDVHPDEYLDQDQKDREDQLKQLFNIKKIEFKEPGESVGSVIKKMGIFEDNEDDVKPEASAPIVQVKKQQLFSEDDDDEIVPTAKP